MGNIKPVMHVVSMYEIHFGGETVSLMPLQRDLPCVEQIFLLHFYLRNFNWNIMILKVFHWSGLRFWNKNRLRVSKDDLIN